MGALLVCALSNNAFAELKLLSSQKEQRGSAYAKMISKSNHSYWVTVDNADSKPSLRLYKFTDVDFRNRNLVGLSYTPILMATGEQHGLLAGMNARGDWGISQFNEKETKEQKHTELKSMLIVKEIAVAGQNYIIAGRNNEDFPVLLLVGDDLRVKREIKLSGQRKGEVSSVFNTFGSTFAVLSFEDGSAELLNLSPNFSILNKVNIAGSAAKGIALKAGGFAVTYSSGQDVLIEKLDSQFRPIWKIKTHTRSGVTTLNYVLCELQDGIGLVGANNGRLMVVRVNSAGTNFRKTEDDFSGLLSPAEEYYSVDVLQNNIHIRGISRKKDSLVDGNSTSFHFVESTTP